MLRHEVAKRGILSLAERWNCPLMWSHYAQQHEGVCLEFSTPENVARNLLRVRYGDDRSIPLSELYACQVEPNSDRKSVVSGRSVAVRLGLGWVRIHKKKKKKRKK